MRRLDSGPMKPESADVLTGLDVLRDLIGHVRLPISYEQETCALSALDYLLERGDRALSDEGKERYEMLKRHLELLDEARILALRDWLEDEGPRSRWSLRKRDDSRARYRLLFILLAHTIANITRYPLLPLLSTQMGWSGNQDERNDRLSWMRVNGAPREKLQLAVLYLQIARQVLFLGSGTHPPTHDSVNADQFDDWHWTQRILCLQTWRHDWEKDSAHRSGEDSGNPALYARRLEFRLARRGSYKRLRKDGGIVAAAAIENLGYRDWRAPIVFGTPVGLFVALVVLLALAVLGVRNRVETWDSFNKHLSAQISSQHETIDQLQDPGPLEADVDGRDVARTNPQRHGNGERNDTYR